MKLFGYKSRVSIIRLFSSYLRFQIVQKKIVILLYDIRNKNSKYVVFSSQHLKLRVGLMRSSISLFGLYLKFLIYSFFDCQRYLIEFLDNQLLQRCTLYWSSIRLSYLIMSSRVFGGREAGQRWSCSGEDCWSFR